MFSNFLDLLTLLNSIYVLLVLNILLIVGLGLLRLRFVQKVNEHKFLKFNNSEPLVSIHLAICNEPPEVVLKTLNSILALNYSNFEVIIISNNTTNKSAWLPIKEFCLNYSSILNFYHFDKVDGYKAGALNIALQKMHTDASYVFTLDADYRLEPEALTIAVNALLTKKVDVIQFPQDYRNICNHTDGLKLHYKHYFECYLSSKKSQKFGLPTGTLTLVRTKVFKDNLEWPTATITEDAHFGIELLERKYSIGFCNVSVGQGTMPITVKDYTKQLKRWIFGNFQTLVLLTDKRISIKKKLRLVTMLTAWINLLAIPIFSIYVLMLLHFITDSFLGHTIMLVGLSFAVHIFFQAYLLLVTSKYDLYKAMRALLVHISTIEIGAFYWMLFFINRKKPFIRTNKFIVPSSIPKLFLFVPITILTFLILNIPTVHSTIYWVLIFISVIMFIGKLQLINEIKYSKSNFLKLFYK